MLSTHLNFTPITASDADELHRHWTDPDVRRYLLDDLVVDRAWVDGEILRSQTNFMHHNWGLWRLSLRENSAFVGVAGFRTFFDPPEIQLIVSLEPAFFNRGLGTEAARRAIRYAFDELGFKRVKGCTDAPNIASQRLMQKCGMRQIERQMIDGVDTVCFEIEEGTEYR